MTATQIAEFGAWVQFGGLVLTLGGFAAFTAWQLKSARKNLERQIDAQRQEGAAGRHSDTTRALAIRRIDMLAELTATASQIVSIQARLQQHGEMASLRLKQGTPADTYFANLEIESGKELSLQLVTLRQNALILAEKYGELPTLEGPGADSHMGDVLTTWFRAMDTAVGPIQANWHDVHHAGRFFVLDLRKLQAIEENRLREESTAAATEHERRSRVLGTLRLKDSAHHFNVVVQQTQERRFKEREDAAHQDLPSTV